VVRIDGGKFRSLYSFIQAKVSTASLCGKILNYGTAKTSGFAFCVNTICVVSFNFHFVKKIFPKLCLKSHTFAAL